MADTWDNETAKYSTKIFNIVKSVLVDIFKSEIINVEGSELDHENCIDALVADIDYNFYGIAFRARKQLYKDLTIRYKNASAKDKKTEYDKLMDVSNKIKPKYHVQVNDAGSFYVLVIIPTNDVIDYMTVNKLRIKTHDDGGQFVIIPWHDLKVQGYGIKAYRIPK